MKCSLNEPWINVCCHLPLSTSSLYSGKKLAMSIHCHDSWVSSAKTILTEGQFQNMEEGVTYLAAQLAYSLSWFQDISRSGMPHKWLIAWLTKGQRMLDSTLWSLCIKADRRNKFSRKETPKTLKWKSRYLESRFDSTAVRPRNNHCISE